MLHRIFIFCRGMAILAGLVLAAGVAVATSPAASAGTVLYYPLHNYNSDLCLGISGGTATAGSPAIQWTCNLSKTQSWGFPAASNGYVYAVNLDNMCLDVNGASKAAGASVIQWYCNSGANQQWYPKVISSYPFVYNLVNRNSGMCLDVNGASKAAGAAVIQWYCNGGTNQEWFLTRGTV